MKDLGILNKKVNDTVFFISYIESDKMTEILAEGSTPNRSLKSYEQRVELNRARKGITYIESKISLFLKDHIPTNQLSWIDLTSNTTEQAIKTIINRKIEQFSVNIRSHDLTIIVNENIAKDYITSNVNSCSVVINNSIPDNIFYLGKNSSISDSGIAYMWCEDMRENYFDTIVNIGGQANKYWQKFVLYST